VLPAAAADHKYLHDRANKSKRVNDFGDLIKDGEKPRNSSLTTVELSA
jgi:hypothetical protein